MTPRAQWLGEPRTETRGHDRRETRGKSRGHGGRETRGKSRRAEGMVRMGGTFFGCKKVVFSFARIDYLQAEGRTDEKKTS